MKKVFILLVFISALSFPISSGNTPSAIKQVVENTPVPRFTGFSCSKNTCRRASKVGNVCVVASAALVGAVGYSTVDVAVVSTLSGLAGVGIGNAFELKSSLDVKREKEQAEKDRKRLKYLRRKLKKAQGQLKNWQDRNSEFLMAHDPRWVGSFVNGDLLQKKNAYEGEVLGHRMILLCSEIDLLSGEQERGADRMMLTVRDHLIHSVCGLGLGLDLSQFFILAEKFKHIGFDVTRENPFLPFADLVKRNNEFFELQKSSGFLR